jgi:hypothetical protein
MHRISKKELTGNVKQVIASSSNDDGFKILTVLCDYVNDEINYELELKNCNLKSYEQGKFLIPTLGQAIDGYNSPKQCKVLAYQFALGKIKDNNPKIGDIISLREYNLNFRGIAIQLHNEMSKLGHDITIHKVQFTRFVDFIAIEPDRSE